MAKAWTCAKCEAENYLCDCEREKLQKEIAELKEGLRHFICNEEPWEPVDWHKAMKFIDKVLKED